MCGCLSSWMLVRSPARAPGHAVLARPLDEATPDPDPDSYRVHVFYGSADRLSAEVDVEAAHASLRAGGTISAAAAGDVDGDGRADILVHRSRGDEAGADLLLGAATRLSGDIELPAAASTRFAGGLSRVAFGDIDLDRDGRDDFALMADPSSGADELFHLFYGRDGGFPPLVEATDADAVFIRPIDLLPGSSHAFAGGDLDGDGHVELAMGDPRLGGDPAGSLQHRGGVLLVAGRAQRFAGQVELELVSQRLLGSVYRRPARARAGLHARTARAPPRA